MACSILEITYSKFISDADGNLIRAVLLCDTAAELPGTTYFSGYTLIQGSTCHVIADNQDYMLDSGGSWHPYGGEMWQNVYTKNEIDTLLLEKQDVSTIDTVIISDIYGLGVVIPNGSDLNDYMTAGVYYVANSTNAATISNIPVGGSGFKLLVRYLSATNRLEQVFLKPNQPEYVYRRTNTGTWSAWNRFDGNAI